MIPGLSAQEVQQGFESYGPNEIRREVPSSAWVLFLNQFKSSMVYLLLGAFVVSLLLKEMGDAIAILIIVILNAVVGFFQEYRAEKALFALRAMTAPRARVIRDGHSQMIPASQVVPGDLLLLEAGDIVAADGKLLEANVLLTHEAALTGESQPVEKDEKQISLAETPLAERRDQVFMGTTVVAGSGSVEITATGMQTELGKIAHLLSTAQEESTPLQNRLKVLSRTLIYLCLGIVALVALLGFLRGQAWLAILLSSVSLAVAAVPEGLPAIVTIALALGVQRMAKRNVLVRRLPAVETLGCTTVICTDKTGTLTTGQMVVRELWGVDHQKILFAGAACNDAELGKEGRADTGDPTELALLKEAAEREIERFKIEKEIPRVEVHPFDPKKKRMSILRSDGVLYVKGAVDLLLPLCIQGIEGALEANAQMAQRGLRVIAIAQGQGSEEKNLVLLGLVGIADPPRTEVIEAVAKAHQAGIRTVMITGDHPLTAQAIAREIGILSETEDPTLWVHARATPEDKIQTVQYWKQRGEVVAMTGDGVNDAPALKEAHIGIAMGKTGTEVTREASDMILSDDNYASIIAAVEEGRGIYENIQKALVYLLSGNMAELFVMLGAALLGFPIPLIPLQLLWINLVTDGFPALALVMDPPAKDLLQRAPRPLTQAILGKSEWAYILWTGFLQTIVTLGTFIWVYQHQDLATARNLAFSVLVFGEVFRSFAARSRTKLFWEVGVGSNLLLLGIVALSVLIQLGIHHIPLTESLFEITPISLKECGVSLLLGLIPVSALELSKIIKRFFKNKKAERKS